MKKLIALFLLSAALMADGPAPPIVKVWNDLYVQIHAFILLEQEFINTPGESPIAAQSFWRDHVKPAFHDVDVVVQNQ